MEVQDFFGKYRVRRCAPGMEPAACEDCDLNNPECCGDYFNGCPLPPNYVFKLKKKK